MRNILIMIVVLAATAACTAPSIPPRVAAAIATEEGGKVIESRTYTGSGSRTIYVHLVCKDQVITQVEVYGSPGNPRVTRRLVKGASCQ